MSSSSDSRGSEPPRYCSTLLPPTLSICRLRIRSSRATRCMGIANCSAGSLRNNSRFCTSPLAAAASSLAASRPSSSGARNLLKAAMPAGSRIKAAWPSPRIVAPARQEQLPHVAAQRLDDDLLGIVQAVDDQSESHVPGLGDHDVLCAAAACRAFARIGAGRAPGRSPIAPAGAAFRGAARLPRSSCAGSASPLPCVSRAPARKCWIAESHNGCRRCARSGRE